jgi:hypothetical protein
MKFICENEGAILGRNFAAHVIFKNSFIWKKLHRFSITKINWLMLFKDIIAVYISNCHHFLKFRISFW